MRQPGPWWTPTSCTGPDTATTNPLAYWNTRCMAYHMKTTLNIDETVMRQLREAAARRGTTMSSLVEAGLRRILAHAGPGGGSPDARPPLPTWRSGGLKVDIANREELYRLLDEV